MPKYRNPNGFGSVVKLGGNRRKPFAVRKTVGYDDRAFPIYEVLGYYATRTEAMLALSNYNASPYDLKLAKSTFEDVYKILQETKFPTMGESLKGQHRASYKYCSPLYSVPYSELRQIHFQRVIDNCGKGYSTQHIIRNFLCTMDRLAYDLEIVPKMRTANLTICQQESKIKRTVFTKDEIKRLWDHQGEPYVDETLVMLYTGMRVSEVLQLKTENVDLEEQTLKGGIKTSSGKNRVIPIHHKILPIIKNHLSGEYVFTGERKNVKNPEKAITDYFSKYWSLTLDRLGIHHYTHDCRHTFRTALDGENRACVNMLMGHKSNDVGERIYTHKTIEELRETIEKLPY